MDEKVKTEVVHVLDPKFHEILYENTEKAVKCIKDKIEIVSRFEHNLKAYKCTIGTIAEEIKKAIRISHRFTNYINQIHDDSVTYLKSLKTKKLKIEEKKAEIDKLLAQLYKVINAMGATVQDLEKTYDSEVTFLRCYTSGCVLIVDVQLCFAGGYISGGILFGLSYIFINKLVRFVKFPLYKIIDVLNPITMNAKCFRFSLTDPEEQVEPILQETIEEVVKCDWFDILNNME